MSVPTTCAALLVAVVATSVICQDPPELSRLDVFVPATLSEDKQICYLADGTAYDRHTRFSVPDIQPCVFLKCTMGGPQVFWSQSGCEYNGACVPMKDEVTVGCRQYKCFVYNHKRPHGTRVGASLSPQPQASCPDGDECRDVGYERRVDPCITLKCQVPGEPLQEIKQGACPDGDVCRDVGYERQVDACTTLKCRVPGEPLQEIKQDCPSVVPAVCDCKTEDGTCKAKGDNYSNDCGTAVCSDIGGGKHAFKPGSGMNSQDCTTPEGVCIRSFRPPHLNVNTCKKYICIRGSVKPPQTLCYKDGQCQANVQPETMNGEDCSCRVNLGNGREEWGCGPFK
ncbi:uncharacterized protein LOC124256815 isoform X2 [Haliotis rubra]|nr:uncharacterized protein LOC124256815 isoform X2 [Haliotis rubra]XP_046546737.1 uncharacterized protein LOC124256815 isoform X2 [Haliotis rubra]